LLFVEDDVSKQDFAAYNGSSQCDHDFLFGGIIPTFSVTITYNIQPEQIYNVNTAATMDCSVFIFNTFLRSDQFALLLWLVVLANVIDILPGWSIELIIYNRKK